MKITRAYKTELDPTEAQKQLLLQYCGAARWVYNWGLEQKIKALSEHDKMPSAFTLSKELRKQRSEIAPWLTEYSTYVIDDTLPHCDRAFKDFFRRCKENKKGKKGFPKFKSCKRGIGSVRFHKEYKTFPNAVRFPRIGRIRLKEHGYLPTKGVKFYSAIISEKAGRWFVSIQCEVEIAEPEVKTGVIGVDFGIKTLAVCSNGKVFENPKALKVNMRKLKRTQRCLRRRESGSNNREKAKLRLSKIHARIVNIRKNTLHNISSKLTRDNQTIVMEDLNIKGMLSNHHLAQAISDCGLYELRRQVEYKSAWRGGTVVTADRWYPSSKTCSSCGAVNKGLKLSHREWLCQGCGAFHNRDFNAAMNLKNLAVKNVATTILETKNACGEESSGSQRIASETIFSEAGTQSAMGINSLQ